MCLIFEQIGHIKSNKRKIKFVNTATEKTNKKRRQEDIDKMIVNFVCDAMIPFKIIENPSFLALMNTAFPNKTILNRRTVAEDILKDFCVFKSALKQELNAINHICVTTDCWTIYHRYD